MDVNAPVDEDFFATIEDTSTNVFVDDNLMVLWHADDLQQGYYPHCEGQQEWRVREIHDEEPGDQPEHFVQDGRPQCRSSDGGGAKRDGRLAVSKHPVLKR